LIYMQIKITPKKLIYRIEKGAIANGF